MNPLVRRYLKTAITFLLIGLGLGLWMLLGREFGVPMARRLRSAHTHALLVGFVLMMIAGVALWMFPRPRAGEGTHQPLLAEVAWWGITGGTGARVVLESWLGTHQEVAWRTAIVVAATLQVAGLGIFFVSLWPRIRSSGANSEGR